MTNKNKIVRFFAAIGSVALLFGTASAGDEEALIIDDECPAKCCLEDPGWCEIFK